MSGEGSHAHAQLGKALAGRGHDDHPTLEAPGVAGPGLRKARAKARERRLLHLEGAVVPDHEGPANRDVLGGMHVGKHELAPGRDPSLIEHALVRHILDDEPRPARGETPYGP